MKDLGTSYRDHALQKIHIKDLVSAAAKANKSGHPIRFLEKLLISWRKLHQKIKVRYERYELLFLQFVLV